MAKLFAGTDDLTRLARGAGYEPGNPTAVRFLSLRQLQRIVRRTTGKTPTELRQELQCAEVDLLIVRGLRNKEIAQRAGFSSEQDPCRVYRKVRGSSPQQSGRLRAIQASNRQ